MDSFDYIADGDAANATPTHDHICIAKDDFSIQNKAKPKHDPILTLFAVAANARTNDEQKGVWQSAW
jgi:hypothetical protein